jgi:hypothetical protein
MMKLVTALAATTIIIFSTVSAEAISLERREDIQIGLRVFPGVNFGDFINKYSFTYGFLMFARGYYQLDLGNNHYIYPELRTGFQYIPHDSESGRFLYLVPLHINFIWDWQRLNFEFTYGQIFVRPFIGLGLNFSHYESKRKTDNGFNPGYNIGSYFEYNNPKIKDVFFDMSLEYNMISEYNSTLFSVTLTFGAGYYFHTDPVKQKQNEFSTLRKKYHEDIMTEDETKIIPAAIWLAKNKEKDIMLRLTQLLISDKRDKVRLNAAFGIGLMEESAGLQPLYQALKSDINIDVKYTCLLSMSRIGPTKDMMKNLRKFKKETKDPYILDYISKMEKMFK